MCEDSKVLVIDDDVVTARVIEARLRHIELDVHCVHSGQQGIAYATQNTPALILLDIHMPEMDGFAVCEELKKNPLTTNIPIIFLTADLNTEIKVKAFDAGATDYITKPFDNRELVARVEAALKMRSLINKLQVQAQTDPLTGLLNRSALFDELSYKLQRQKSDADYQFAVLFLDFDRFKVINDSLGHSAGNELLIRVTRSMVDMLDHELGHNAYTAARMGGDEFVLLIDQPINHQMLTKLAEKLQTELHGPYHIEQFELICSASIGIVLSSGNYEDPESLLRDADIAMYHAKENGKSQSCFFSQQMHEQTMEQLTLEGDLRHALARHELKLLYQPIHCLATGKLTGFEALIRWHHPVRGVVSPLTFIPIAEESGLIVPIGWWILYEAASQLKLWRQMYPSMRNLRVNVNLSKRQLITPDFVKHADDILRKTGLPHNAVTLEITESTIMDNMSILTPMLEQLRQIGFKLAMDDFGTGHSSLGCLNKFPLDSLKIDRSFINNVDKNHSFAAILNSIVTLAHNLNLVVVAEGIEKLEQLAHLQSLDCDYGQGYLFAKPTDADAIPSLIEQLNQKFRKTG
ncbi:MAG: EAL domain-containing protein [Phycisphaeraceae bacterium JB051]